MNKERGSKFDKYNEEFKFNKNAFDDVIGDPFALEYIPGNYMVLRKRSVIRVANNEFDMGKATKNAAQPSLTDFFCDVETTVENALGDAGTVEKFYATYIFETSETEFTPKERSQLEQKIGKLFRTYKLSPVSKYFQTVRQSVGSIKERDRTNGNPRSSNPDTRSKLAL